jgi:hypothetical protein
MKIVLNVSNRVINLCIIFILIIFNSCKQGGDNERNTILQYSVSMSESSNHLFHVVLNCKGLKGDTIDFMVPWWMPGYYRIMNYQDGVKNFSVNSPILDFSIRNATENRKSLADVIRRQIILAAFLIPD